jgi:HD superfamily phosphohydrolase
VNEGFLYYICFGPYSADIIDYLLRDSYFTGAGYGNVDWKRLVHVSRPFRDKLLLEARGEEAFDSLLLARLAMFFTVYYHRTARAAAKEMELFLRDAKEQFLTKYVTDLDSYAKLDENFLLSCDYLKDSPHRDNLLNRTIPYHRVPPDITIRVRDLQTRRLLRSADEQTEDLRRHLPAAVREKLPKDSFFVDTPAIDANPMFDEEYVYVCEEDSPNRPIQRDILETKWGPISREFWIVRLYVREEYKKHEDDLRQAFAKIHRSRTHF